MCRLMVYFVRLCFVWQDLLLESEFCGDLPTENSLYTMSAVSVTAFRFYCNVLIVMDGASPPVATLRILAGYYHILKIS